MTRTHCTVRRNKKKQGQTFPTDRELALIEFAAGRMLQTGQMKEALRAVQRALPSRVLREDHPNTAKAHDLLATFHLANNKVDKALEHCAEFLRVRRVLYGDRHPKLVRPLHNMSSIQSKRGAWDKSLACCEQAWDIVINGSNPTPQAISLCHAAFGRVYEHKKDYDQTFVYYEKAYKVLQDAPAQAAVHTAELSTAHQNLGYAYCRKDEWEKGMEHLRRAVKLCRRDLGDKHPATRQALTFLGQARYTRESGSFDEGKNKSADVVLIKPDGDETHTLTHQEIDANIYKVCGLLIKQHQVDQAIECARNSLARHRRAPTKDWKKIGRIHGLLALAYAVKDKHAEVVKHYTRAIDLLNKAGDESVTLAEMHYSVAATHDLQGRFDKGIEHCEQALAILQRLPPTSDKNGQLGICLNVLGKLYQDKGELDRAAGCYNKTVLLFQREKQPVDLSHSYQMLGEIHYYKKEWERSLEYFQQSWELRQRCLGEHHEFTQVAQARLRAVRVARQMYTKANFTGTMSDPGMVQ